MKLSKRETIIYQALQDGRTRDMHSIALLIWPDGPPIKAWRSVVGKTILLLRAKTQAMPIKVIKVQGAYGEFRAVENSEKLKTEGRTDE